MKIPKLVIAHRGANREAPENTRRAFDTALAHGVDGLEFDIQLTRDEVPVIFHDRTLSKIGRRRRRISDFSLAELKELDWGSWFDPSFSGEPLLTLEAMLKRYGRRTGLFVEIKSREHDRSRGRHNILTSLVIDQIKRYVPVERMRNVFILSYDREVLELAHDGEPGWQYVLNIERPSDFNERRPSGDVSLMACCVPIRNLTYSFVVRMRRQGIVVFTYACNTPGQVTKAHRGGVEVIMTDKPGWLMLFLQGRGED